MWFCCHRLSPLERKMKSQKTNGETLKVCEGTAAMFVQDTVRVDDYFMNF